MAGQEIFSGINYGFEWTSSNWYRWDRKAGNAAALKARNARARKLRKQGHTVHTFSLGESLVSQGGVGSGRPHIELLCKAYGLNIY